MSTSSNPQALSRSPSSRVDVEAPLAQANAYAEREHWAEAREAYATVLGADPDNEEAHNALGIVCEELNDPAGAERHYRAALAARPDYFSAYTNLAAMYEEQGDTCQAMQTNADSLPYAEDPATRSRLESKVSRWRAQQRMVRRFHGRFLWLATVLFLLGVNRLFPLQARPDIESVVLQFLMASLLCLVRIPSTYLVLAVLFGFSALGNLLSGANGADGLFSLPYAPAGMLQALIAVWFLRTYRTYAALPLQALFSDRDWPSALPLPAQAVRLATRMSQTGALLGLACLLLVPAVTVFAGVPAETGTNQALAAISSFSTFAIGLSVGGIGGSKTHRRWAVVGVVAGIAAILLSGAVAEIDANAVEGPIGSWT